ncbi:uncharacterized protein LOC115949702 [Quercus lobata]|uniref:uncharacterized protein LOC115949702 n=1 Tax=Quercus lobata TaxID=97700 RepID=UPI001243C757|nr:uncharacterized protein LOC115949702 [Quercus lobata]
MVKKKSKDGGSNDPRADWKEPKELQAFCEFYVVQVIDGKKKGGFLTKTGVDAVMEQLGAMGKVGGSSITSVLTMTLGWVMMLELGMFEASDEWWTRKIMTCPNAKTFKNKGLLNCDFPNIMFGGTVASGKNAFCTSGQTPKETTEGSGTPLIARTLLTPNVNPL